MRSRQDIISQLSKAYYLAFTFILALVGYGYLQSDHLVDDGREAAEYVAKLAELNKLAYEITGDMVERDLDLVATAREDNDLAIERVTSNLGKMRQRLYAVAGSSVVERANESVPVEERADFVRASYLAYRIQLRWERHQVLTDLDTLPAVKSLRGIQDDTFQLQRIFYRASNNLVQYSDSNRAMVTAYLLTTAILISVVLLLHAVLIHRRLIRSLRQSSESLLSQQVEISAQNEKLVGMSADLERQNHELQAHQADLAMALQEQKVSNELLTLASVRFQQLFHSTPVACFSCDLDGNVYEWNAAAELLFGYEAFRMFEQNAIDLLCLGSNRDEFTRLLSTAAETQAASTAELDLTNIGGGHLRVQVSVMPVRGGQGHISGVIAACVDLTEIRQAQERVRLLSVVAETTINGIMVTDPDERVIYCNRAFEDLFGYSLEEMRGRKPKEVLQGVGTNPESRVLLRNAINELRPVKTEIINYRKDGAPVTVDISVTPVLSDCGELQYFASVLSDISERKQAEIQLRHRDHQFSAIMTAIQSGVMLYGPDGQLSLANPYALEALGLLSDNQSHNLPEGWALTNIDGEPIGTDFTRFSLVTERLLGETVVIRCPDLPEVILSVDTLPIVDPQTGASLGGVRAFTNVTETFTMQRQLETNLLEIAEINLQLELQTDDLEKLNSKLEALATTDGLTGLTNHRAFQERLEAEIKRATQTGKPFSLALLDVDHFKLFNDSFGHPAGDEILKGVAEQLLQVARGSDLVARYGGEEFVLILPRTGAKGAESAVERYRKAIDDHVWPHRHVTASFGVATFQPGLAANELIEQADKALYASKSGGRNRCTHYRDLHSRNAEAA